MADGRAIGVDLSDIAGAVLTGGSSRRMGRDKALIEIDGEPMVDRVGAVLERAGCIRVVAVGPASLAGRLQHIDDLYPGEGPLGGILTAFSALANEAELVCVLACDLPSLDAVTINKLLHVAREGDSPSAFDVVMARTDRLEPLCAIWSRRCAPTLQSAFDDGQRAIHAVLQSLTVTAVQVAPAALHNVNTPDDLPSR